MKIKEDGLLATKRREKNARALEHRAQLIRMESDAIKATNDDYSDICTTVEESAAGTLNLASYHPTCTASSSDALCNAVHYRDLAEELKAENRKLRVEMSDKIDTVRRFWRNSILEESTVQGKCYEEGFFGVINCVHNVLHTRSPSWCKLHPFCNQSCHVMPAMHAILTILSPL